MEKQIVRKKFSVDLAKQIIRGNVAGKIYLSRQDGYKYPVDILTFNSVSNRRLVREGSDNWRVVVVLAHFDNYDKVYEFNTDGYGTDEHADDIVLFIEVEVDVPEQNRYVYEFDNNPAKAIKAGCDINQMADKITVNGIVMKNRHGDVSQTFKPFDKVLVRDFDDKEWVCDLFSHSRDKKYVCVGSIWNQCIPYSCNEHLVGTTVNPMC